MAIGPYLLASPWQHKTHHQKSEYMFANNYALPLKCGCKIQKINNFTFSENLRPKLVLVDSGPLWKAEDDRVQDAINLTTDHSDTMFYFHV